MLEAKKDNLINQVYDMRLLLDRVNEEGENKLQFLSNKNVRI